MITTRLAVWAVGALVFGVPVAAAGKARFGYDKGVLVSDEKERFVLRFNARLQTRFTFDALERPDERVTDAAFSIPRTRFKLAGQLFSDALTYQFQFGIDRGVAIARDFYADLRLVKGWLHLRAGQWKRPFSRQQINSTEALQLVDRATTDAFFRAGRDIGLALGNAYESSPRFEWVIGVFNGTGDATKITGAAKVDGTTHVGTISDVKITNVPVKLSPALVLRVGYNHGGILGYREGDLEGGPLRFALAGSLALEADEDHDRSSAIRGEVDYALKWRHFASTGALYVASKQNGERFRDQTFDSVGAHVQFGYTIRRRVEPVLRYTWIAPVGPHNDQYQLTAGVNGFIYGHQLKAQLDGTVLWAAQGTPGMRVDYQLRAQLQFGL